MTSRARLLRPSIASLLLALSIACAGRRGPRPPEVPASAVQEGLASWYGIEERGRATASGEIMDPERHTAAHRSLPFGTVVRVTELEAGRHVDVVINDRGPFVRGRIIDLSFGAARELGIVQKGVARVRVQVAGLDGNLAERRWRVQVGSFEDAARARELRTRLQAAGYSPVLLSAFEEGARRFHRVWVGAFYERGGAERLANELLRDGHRGFVVLAAATSP